MCHNFIEFNFTCVFRLYIESLQCLHEHFLLCAPANQHLVFMQQQLPDPDVMLPSCFPDTYDFKTSAAVRVATTPIPSTSPVLPQNADDSLNSLNNFAKNPDQHWPHSKLPRLNDSTKHRQQHPNSLADVITTRKGSKSKLDRSSSSPGSDLDSNRLHQINTRVDRTFQNSNVATTVRHPSSGFALVLFTICIEHIFWRN